MSNQPNHYLPSFGKILETKQENSLIKSFLVSVPDTMQNMQVLPGQFFQLSLLGYGEIPISLSEYNPEKKTYLFCIANTGAITSKIHQLSVGEEIGIRGPYGNGFPIAALKGKNIIVVAGGIGLVPLRSIIHYSLTNPGYFAHLEILFGAKSTSDFIYKEEIKQWRLKPDTTVKVTIDKAEKAWNGNVGFVTSFLQENCADHSEILFSLDPSFENTVILVVGPPVMYKNVFRALEKIEFPDKKVYLSLENHMKCGIGKCGHCNCGEKYVCLDGPIFSWLEMKSLPKEY
jgi:NAD(P)H-flavin reductase